MSRHRLSTSPITALSAALLLAVAGGVALGIPAAKAAAPGTDSTWKATTEAANPFHGNAPAEWSPVRPRQPVATTPQFETPDDNAAPASRPRVSQASTFPNPVHGAAPTSPAGNTRWQLPNGQSRSASPTAQRASAGQKQPPTSAPVASVQEPKPFKAPTNATRLSPAVQATNNPPWSSSKVRTTTVWPPQSASAANPASSPRGPGIAPNTNTPTNRPTTAGRVAANERAMNHQRAHGVSANASPVADNRSQNSFSGRSMWNSITVAFQAPETWAEGSTESENLPMPSGSKMQNGPMMHEGHEMAGPEFDGGYGYEGGCTNGSCPHGGPGGCSCPGGCGECGPMCGDGCCGCEPGCGCGCGCEVGCACEPGCGCPQGGCDINFCGQGDPEACTTIRIGAPKWQEFMLFAGVQGFKGPYDQFRDSGNFGFHEGFNAGFKMPFTSMGYQIGYQGVHSQLSGDKDTDISDPHTQQFTTLGVFQRAKDGFQWGLAYDVLRDERWGAVDFHQLRTELSFVDHGCHEIGFAGAFHLNDDEQFFFNDQEEIFSTIYQASDQYLLFYRFHGCNGGEGRFYGGFNDDSDGIIGADMLLPLSNRWSLQAAFTYLIPEEPGGEIGAQQEAWNLSMALVWHWDCRARRCHNNCYRPLFNVADNGYLIVDDRPGSHLFD